MKPLKPKRQLSEIRVTRKSNLELKHGDGHGWAVSYADLLMVLLSFFVLYFNFSSDDPAKAQSEMIKIAMSMRGEVITDDTKASSSAAEEQKDATEATAPQLPENLVSQFKKSGLKVTGDRQSIILEFKPKLYSKGNYNISKELKGELDFVMAKLKPFEHEITVTVIGHTDMMPLRPRNELLLDNFDLSSIRALRVLKYIRATGFDETRLNARAESSHSRASRTISFELKKKSSQRQAASEAL